MKGRYSECRGFFLTGINNRTVKCFETVHDKYENKFPSSFDSFSKNIVIN